MSVFKTGDKCVVLASRPSGANLEIGDVVTKEDGEGRFDMYRDINGLKWALDDKHLELHTLVASSTVTSDNPVFHYKASDDLSSDAWGTLVKATHDSSDLPVLFFNWEDEYKSVTSEPLPGAYRSAKSVINNANKYGIPTVLDGFVRGKSAVEADIKQGKGTLADILDPKAALRKKINAAAAFANQHGMDFRQEVKEYFIDITPTCTSIDTKEI